MNRDDTVAATEPFKLSDPQLEASYFTATISDENMYISLVAIGDIISASYRKEKIKLLSRIGTNIVRAFKLDRCFRPSAVGS